MNLYLRLLSVMLTAVRKPRIAPLGESRLSFRVWPNDLDFNGHMNNGRYLTLMDLGRLDLVARLGLGRTVIRRGWRPVVASALIRYRRSLMPFQTYELVTRMLCWDQKWLFMEQRFERDGKTVAVANVKGLFRGPAGNVPSSELVEALGEAVLSPPMPESVELWLRAEALAVAA